MSTLIIVLWHEHPPSAMEASKRCLSSPTCFVWVILYFPVVLCCMHLLLKSYMTPLLFNFQFSMYSDNSKSCSTLLASASLSSSLQVIWSIRNTSSLLLHHSEWAKKRKKMTVIKRGRIKTNSSELSGAEWSLHPWSHISNSYSTIPAFTWNHCGPDLTTLDSNGKWCLCWETQRGTFKWKEWHSDLYIFIGTSRMTHLQFIHAWGSSLGDL